MQALIGFLHGVLTKINSPMKKSTSMILLVIGVLLLVGVLAWILTWFLPGTSTEIEIGIIIVIAVVALMLSLFIMVAGFNILNLNRSETGARSSRRQHPGDDRFDSGAGFHHLRNLSVPSSGDRLPNYFRESGL